MVGEQACEAITFEDIERAAGVLEAMVSELDVDTLTGEGATRLVKRLVVNERVVATARAKAAKRAADANQWRHAGERSPASWLAALTGTTTGQAAAELETTKKLVDLPATAAARAAGQLSESQARQVADAATADPGAEAELLAHAATDDAAALARRCLAVKAAAEQDETAAREKIRQARRHRSWTDGEGAFCYAGRGLPEDRAALEAALKPYQDQAFHAARRRGEREASEAYAYDALISLANHQCPPGTSPPAGTCPAPPHGGTDPTPAPGAGTGPAPSTDRTDTTAAPGAGAGAGDGDGGGGGGGGGDSTGRAARRRPDDETPGAATLWDGSPAGDTSTTTAETARAASIDGAEPAGSGPTPAGHSSADTEATSTGATTDDIGRCEHDHTGDEVTGSGGDPKGATSNSDTAATDTDTGTEVASPRLGPQAKVIVRIDHTALVRGHTVPGEVCEIAGVGPIPVAAARELARDAFLTAVVTDGVDIRSVAHLGRAATAPQRTALEARGIHCAVPGCGVVHHLEIDHVDGWAITRRTQLDQLDWLCRHHHDQKTHRSYRLAGPPGNRTWHRPDRRPPPAEPGEPPPDSG